MPPPSIAARTPDGKTLLINRGNALQLWRSDAPSTFKRLEFPGEGVGRTLLDPSGSTLYYLSQRNDSPLKLTARPLDNREPQRALWSINVSQVTSLAISADEKNLAVGERSGAVALIDPVRGIVKFNLNAPLNETGPVDSLAFTLDGQTLAISAREQVRLWAVDGEPRPLVRLPGHRGAIRSLAFDTKGTRLAGADEKTIKVWDLDALRGELARLGLDW
jgi:WD40 repeat protein